MRSLGDRRRIALETNAAGRHQSVMPDREYERMIAGELYLPADPEIVELRRRARRLTRAFNTSSEEQLTHRAELLKELLASVGARVEIEPPFQCDYGGHIHLGDDVFVNFGCVILDCAHVKIGSRVLLGPGVHIYAATHPTDPEARKSGRELALPVTIGDDVWIGGGVVICPGVTIGSRSTIGAGSVVVRDIPPGVVAAGNPCRVLREL
jgi:maltose O-acetyltransferase